MRHILASFIRSWTVEKLLRSGSPVPLFKLVCAKLILDKIEFILSTKILEETSTLLTKGFLEVYWVVLRVGESRRVPIHSDMHYEASAAPVSIIAKKLKKILFFENTEKEVVEGDYVTSAES